jgi:geranylgeranyl reductase family protein
MDYDVVVVGAGPAGSATARGTAASGLKTLIVDKRLEVGQPALCSGLVSPRTLKEAGISDEPVIDEIKGASFHSALGRELYLGGDKVYALAIDRPALDSSMAERAQEAGAHLQLDTKLIDIQRQGKHLQLALNGNGNGRHKITTRMLVGADGVGSFVGRWLGAGRSDNFVRAVAAEGRLDGGEPQLAKVFLGSSFAPGWFGWMIPLGNGRVRVGTGDGIHSSKSPKRLFNDMVAAFPSHFRGIEFDRVWMKAIPVYSPINTYGDNVLLVGDAARQVKPTSGGGIYTSLVGARHCAKVVTDAVKEDDYSSSFLARYETQWKAELGPELEKGVDLRRALLSLKDEEIDELLALLNNPVLRRLFSRFGDVDFQSPVMEQLFRATPLLRRFLRVPLRFPYHWATDLFSAIAGGDGRKEDPS